MSLIFDGHLDIAMNALGYERDQRLPVDAIRLHEHAAKDDGRETPTVSLDAMRRGGVACCLATVIARTKPVNPERGQTRRDLDYPTQDMTHAAAMAHLAYYRALERQGEIRIIETARDLNDHWDKWQSADGATRGRLPVGVIVTMEGADPIVEPKEVHLWWSLGLRTLMLSHTAASPYAYGTPPWNAQEGAAAIAQGPLTDKGRQLISEIAGLGMALDLTHLCDQSFFEAYEAHEGSVYASHSNCRALVNKPRQLTDEQLKLIIGRGGVIGVVLCNSMLREGTREMLDHAHVGLDAVAEHIDHICQLAGDANHVALGSDLDGGFGVEWSPREIDTIADLQLLEGVLARRGTPAADITAILQVNWLSYWTRVLPE